MEYFLLGYEVGFLIGAATLFFCQKKWPKKDKKP